MQAITRRAGALALTTFLALPLAAQAALIPLAPGDTVLLGAGTTNAADPSLAGLVVADELRSFSGTDFAGTAQTRVVRRDDTGTLDFYYRITEYADAASNTRALRDFRIADYAGWATSVSYRPDGSGTEGPTTAVRFPQPQCPACDGINFSFRDTTTGQPLFASGDDSLFMLIRTEATAYTQVVADVYLVSLPGRPFDQWLSTAFTVFAPTVEAHVPEPQSLALAMLALAAAGAAARRKGFR